jgi:phosphoglycolate phosphatase-like HAD superfamily hydrolase
VKIRQLHHFAQVQSVEVSTPNARLDPAPAVLLLDLDGTLVDTMQPFADLAADVIARRYGLVLKNARNLYLQTSGVPFCQQLDVIFGDHEENAAAAMEFEARKHNLAAAAEMEPESLAALERLHRRGVNLVVSSNGMQEHVDRFAARTPGLFAMALGYGSGLHKGEPHVSRVCRALAVERDELAFVGDSLRDGELAASCSVRFVGRAGTFSRDELSARFPGAPIVDTIAELPAAL